MKIEIITCVLYHSYQDLKTDLSNILGPALTWEFITQPYCTVTGLNETPESDA